MATKKQMRCDRCGEVHARLGLEIVGNVMRRTVTDCAGQMVRVAGGAWAYKSHVIFQHPEIERYEVIAGDVRYIADRETMQSKGFTQTLSVQYGPQKILPLRYWQIEHGVQIAKPKPKRARRAKVEHNAIEHATIERAQRAQELRENVHGLQLTQLGFAGPGWRVRM